MSENKSSLTAQQWQWLGSLFDLLEAHLGKNAELVLREPGSGTVLDLRNGHISGGAGRTVPAMSAEGCNQLYFSADGRILRCSALTLPGGDGCPAAEVCINEDITDSVAMENYLHRRNQGGGPAVVQDVGSMLETLLEEAQLQVGKSAQAMTRAEKKEVVHFLDERGAFLIAKSGPRVCQALGISKFTLYNYLDAMRGAQKE